MNDAPEIMTVEAALVLVVRSTIPLASMAQAQTQARAILSKTVTEPSGPNLTIWCPPDNGMIDYAPGVFIAEDAVPPEGTSLFMLPKGRAAYLCYQGAYAGLPDAWARLFQACAKNNWEPAGLNWEVYTKPALPEANAQTGLYALLAP